MRYVVSLVTLLLIPSVVFAQAEPADPEDLAPDICQTKKDEFTQTTQVTCPTVNMTIEKHPGETLYQSRAILVKRKGTVSLHFAFSSSTWQFLQARKVYGLVDGENSTWKLHEVATETQSGGSVYEEYAIILNQDDLKQISDYKSFRIKINQSVFDLSDTPLPKHAKYIIGVD